VAISFIDGGNRSNVEKTTDLPQVSDKLNVVSSTPHQSGIQTHNVNGDKY
jgi:hypothetical protein